MNPSEEPEHSKEAKQRETDSVRFYGFYTKSRCFSVSNWKFSFWHWPAHTGHVFILYILTM